MDENPDSLLCGSRHSQSSFLKLSTQPPFSLWFPRFSVPNPNYCSLLLEILFCKFSVVSMCIFSMEYFVYRSKFLENNRHWISYVESLVIGYRGQRSSWLVGRWGLRMFWYMCVFIRDGTGFRDPGPMPAGCWRSNCRAVLQPRAKDYQLTLILSSLRSVLLCAL